MKGGTVMKKKHYCDNSHLTLDERKTIQIGIENRSTKTAIAKTIGKDPTTVAKEIRKHRVIKPRNKYGRPNICVNRRKCGNCKKRENSCPNYQELTCKGRDKSPGACNKCPKSNNCYLTRYFYYANLAQQEYQRQLVESRVGINIDKKEIEVLAEIVVPLVLKGQSIYQILLSHPEIKQCEKTIYNYIDQGVFKSFGLDYFSLKEKVQRKQPKIQYKKRNEKNIFKDRKYIDYLRFTEDNPDIPTVEMDTVYNNQDGPYIQTLLFKRINFMIGFIHQEKTSSSMATTFDQLEKLLGYDIFIQLFPLLLTDRGSEFCKHNLFEYSGITGEFRLNIFYCDPMRATQKPNVENNHNYVRDILPKNINLTNLSNQDLQLIFSHINNTPRRSLNGRTPYDLFELLYTKDVLDSLNIKKLHHDEITLRPSLVKPK